MVVVKGFVTIKFDCIKSSDHIIQRIKVASFVFLFCNVVCLPVL